MGMLTLYVVVKFSVLIERLSIFISPLARLLAIDSWFKTLHSSGSVIANYFEALQQFPCKLPPPQFLTKFSHPSIYFPLSIEVISSQRIDYWNNVTILEASISSWKVRSMTFCRLCHYFGRMIFSD